MNRFTLALVIIGVTAIFAIQVAIIFIKVALPNVGDAPVITVQKTPERLARGKYLAHHVAVCMDCHSGRDWTKFSGPIKPGTLGMGGEVFTREMGFPGTIYASNITPEGLTSYSDGELLRLITTGVTDDNKAIFPIMPYHSYGLCDTEDILSIIAYIRSLPTIRNEVPESKIDFPMSILVNTIPKKANPNPMPPFYDTLAYGKYLVTMAACYECHTKYEKGAFVEGMDFAGGREFKFPNGNIVRSSNLTPDKETGLGWTTRTEFVNKFKQYTDSSFVLPDVGLRDKNTVMPWTMYAGMTEDDLSAIFKYLKSLKPVAHKFENYTLAAN